MAIPAAAEPTAAPGIAAQIELARRAAIEVFGNCAGVELMHDPECPGESWHVFSVVDVIESGDYKASIRRELRWHARVRELIPSVVKDLTPDFRLSIVVEP
jgi:hypothetical protein